MVLAAFILLLGCSFLGEKIAKKTVEKTTGVSVEEEGKKVKIKTKEGEAEVETGEKKLPNGFPDGFPIYEDATIKNSTKMTVNNETTFQVFLEAEGDSAPVAEYYKKSLPKSGYEIENSFEADNAFTYNIKQGENLTGTVSIGPNKDKTSVIITLTVK
jgi:hypothetical protein